jgi:hypothetical protein
VFFFEAGRKGLQEDPLCFDFAAEYRVSDAMSNKQYFKAEDSQ